MAAGYFNDGTLDVELGAHVFVSPRARRRNLRLKPYDRAATVLDSGGGVLEMKVTGQRLRANLGDGERYIYETLYALATSSPGDLAFEDNRAHRHVFGDSVCIGGSGQVLAFRFADMRLDFACPEKSSEPAFGAVPAAPAAYPGTTNAQDYTAGGVDLGQAGVMRIEMQRSVSLRELPRARGARTSVPPSGALIRFLVETERIAATENLATDLEDLARAIGPGPVTLTANGNAYGGVVLEGIRPRHTDRKHTVVECELVQDIAAHGAWHWTTTTAAPATTTTTSE